ncbi:hypothetical protein [uncultured Williamsia sp.]|uniref:hypothetical protein n=1 Tax=uncultured Williamsia sp. TaxID=259311 RepID=UPI00262A29E6|nr:hypothetical protein [uncultured Williamsia sp.]
MGTNDDADAVLRRPAALASGLTDRLLEARVRAGELERLRPGVWVPTADRLPEASHRLRVLACPSHTLPVSHQSAAVMHGLGLLHPDFSRVHVTTGTASGGRVHPTRHIHSGLLGPEETVVVDGVPTTSIERTAVDVACGYDFDAALVVFDSALRAGADREVMAETIARGRRRGNAAARIALPLADGAAESVGESWSRAQMITARLPTARLQHERRVRGRRIVTDFDWDRQLVGEFDGHVKYGRLLKPGQTVADVVEDEKAREDLLRWDGSMVVRWIWADLERRRVASIVQPWLGRLGLI